MSKFTEEFTRILEEHQKKTKQTYKEIANQAEISHSTLSCIKSGRIKRPTPKLLARLDKVFGLPESYLLVSYAREHIPDTISLLWQQIIKEYFPNEPHVSSLPFPPIYEFAFTCEDVVKMKPDRLFYLEAGGHDTVGGDIHEGDLLKIMPKAKIKSGNFVLWIRRGRYLSIRRYRQFGNRVHLIPLVDTIPTAIIALLWIKRVKLMKIVELIRENPKM